MAKKKASKKAADDTETTFDDALIELQSIVDVMEDGSLGLEESLGQYEKGIRLLRTCYQKLDAAEQRIELLTQFQENGEITTEPFHASATAETQSNKAGRRKKKAKTKESEPTNSDDSDDDTTLF